MPEAPLSLSIHLPPIAIISSPPTTMASPSSSSPFRSPPSHFPRSPLFTPIPEHDDIEEEEEEPEPEQEREREEIEAEEEEKERKVQAQGVTSNPKKKQEPTPPPASRGGVAVNCSNCRPCIREKKASNTTVVPLDQPSSSASPHTPGVLKSLLTSLTLNRRGGSATTTTTTPTPPQGGDWKDAASLLSRKLLVATRSRDAALQEVSSLRHSMADLEHKLSRLESRCSSLLNVDHDHHHPSSPAVGPALPLDAFLRAVSEARTMVRHLARSLYVEVRQAVGPSRAADRICSTLERSCDLRVPRSAGGSRSTLLFHLEGLLNLAFHEDFETSAFERVGVDLTLDPFQRTGSNRAAYEALKLLTWEEVLSKGTRHYSVGLSGFCDRKMSEVMVMLGWGRAWPEPLLQAFFCAAKAVWLVHLLAWSVHPAIPPFRVGAGARFDPAYMEDVDRLEDDESSSLVQMVVAPGFYVYSSVIKSKVLCTHSNGGGASGSIGDHVEQQLQQQLARGGWEGDASADCVCHTNARV